MTTQIHPIYAEFFPAAGGQPPADWNRFKVYNQPKDLPDFSITSKKSWCDTVVKILKILILPYLLYQGARALIGRLAMRLIYPAQQMNSERVRNLLARALPRNNHVWREVTLQKDGVSYNGILIGMRNQISNGKWAIFAPGNNTSVEDVLWENNHIPFFAAGYNLLMINAPNVGRSQGPFNTQAIGEAQEMAITFVETALKANKVVLSGHSMGAAAIGEACKKHEFKPNVEYLAIRLMTFDKLSHVVRKYAGPCVEKVLHWLDFEMDQTAASRVLQEKGIHEVIFEAGRDQIMVGATLVRGLQRANLLGNKTINILHDAEHNDLPTAQITEEIRRWDAPPVAAAG